jgi:endonuclease VIII
MPEGDIIFRAARTLNRALAGKTVTSFKTVLPKLSRIDEDHPITGRTIESVESSGKWLSIHFSGDLVLLTHMRMNGSWHIYRPQERWQRPSGDMRIVIETPDFVAVGFDIPVAEFHSEKSLAERSGVSRLGSDILAAEFDPVTAAAALRSAPALGVGEALLQQSLIAGLGNVYKSEVCFACSVNPFRLVSSLTDSELECLIRTAQKFLAANVTDASGSGMVTYSGFRRTTGRANSADRLWVYARAGQPCRRCGTPVQRSKQYSDARVTFWCPECQALPSDSRQHK